MPIPVGPFSAATFIVILSVEEASSLEGVEPVSYTHLFSLFWEIMAIKSKVVFMMLWGLPFVGIGAYLLLGSPIRAAYLRNRTYYVITNKKIIIKKGSKIEMHDGRDLPPMDIEIHKNGNGTIPVSYTHLDVYKRQARAGVSNDAKKFPLLNGKSDVADSILFKGSVLAIGIG